MYKRQDGDCYAAVWEKADEALYKAKKSGGDQVGQDVYKRQAAVCAATIILMCLLTSAAFGKAELK